MTAKRTYAFTTGGLGAVQSTIGYSYDDSTWGDLLTNFCGQNIEYDEIGNPVKIGWYDDSNGYWEDGYELTWSGRQLISYTYFEDYGMEEIWYRDPIEFIYNADGIRTSKTAFGTRHEYILNGSQIVAEKWNNQLLEYIYDEVGSPIGMKYRTSSYAENVFDVFLFEKNLQGDIVAVYNSSGTKLVSYTYDAWGNCTATYPQGYSAAAKAMLNPFRYRGYYYDDEIGWYYLQSRYYNPSWGRFINADAYVNANGDIVGFNMFAYCSNNPVTKVDYDGREAGDLFDSEEAAALDFALCYNAKSISDKQEYGSAIYKVTKVTITYPKTPWYLLLMGIRYAPIITRTTKYSYTKPSIGKEGNCVTPNFSTTKPIVSTVHTHANYDPKYDNENFSKGFASDIGWSNFFMKNSYVVTPGGYLKKYTYKNRKDANGGVTVIANNIPWDPNSPDH